MTMNVGTKTALLAGTIAASLLAAVGCGTVSDLTGQGNKSKASPTYTPIVVPGRACPTGSVLTWENFGEPFMLSHCTGCHSSQLDGSGPPPGNRQGAPPGVNFDTYDLTRSFGITIYQQAADDNTLMPPKDNIPVDNPVSVDDRVALGDWIACNMPTDAMLAAGQ